MRFGVVYIIIILLAFASCGQRNTILPGSYSLRTTTDYNGRDVIPGYIRISVDSISDLNSDIRVAECMKFLYAYMPLNDLADYSPSFFLDGVVAALRSRDEMPWGRSIPPELFLHFVLPPRVNNENLDSFRITYYNEIKSRVEGLSVTDAAIEINRWCHEKVTYQPSDIRTSSPMATMLSARGRCGEESTFTVAALRTAGIPARQVYTPRWAHTDDNHAWVEVWTEEGWKYLGACEPEPVLDRGWFTEPARRAMLVHTKAFGYYTGNEQIVRREKQFAEINNLAKYAPAKHLTVRVTDDSGVAMKGIPVEFCLFNYAEFYPIARIETDSLGYCSFLTGLGDLLVTAGYGDSFGFDIVSVALTDTLLIIPGKLPDDGFFLEADLKVPARPEPFPGIDPQLAALNRNLLARGDSIREAYIATWIPAGEAAEFALKNGYNPGTVVPLIMKSQGNYKEILSFLAGNTGQRELVCSLLAQLAEKDLRDTRRYILEDHLNNVAPFNNLPEGISAELYNNYILNPRVANEMLVNWRGLLKPPASVSSPAEVIRKVLETVSLHDRENYYGTPVTPAGVAITGLADRWSAGIYAVASLRAAGIPARLEPGTNIPQYYLKGEWIDVVAPFVDERPSERAFITFSHTDADSEPEYYSGFSLAMYRSGRYNTLTWDYNRKVSEFPAKIPVTPGYYMMVTGSRSGDTSIMAGLRFFSLSPQQHLTADVTPRQAVSDGNSAGMATSALMSRVWGTGRNGPFLAVWMNPETEPAKHFLNDLPARNQLLKSWPGKIVFFTPDETAYKKLAVRSNNLPVSIIETDTGLRLLAEVAGENVAGDSHNLPFVILVSADNRVLYRSSGYRIGIAGQIARTITQSITSEQ